MKRMAMALLMLAALAMAATGAAEQVLPSNACFSPGLVSMSRIMAEGAGVQATAQFTAEDVLYVRDLSIFEQMLSGAVFTYGGKPGYDSLTIAREGETLCDMALYDDVETGVAVLSVNGRTMELDGELLTSDAAARLMQADAFLTGTPILERAPLADVADWFEWFEEGDEIAAGYAVAVPFAVERTMSDDGTRLTRIDIDGEIAAPDGETWTVSGYLRQPAGTQPKDTFKITIKRDEKNYFEIEYSAQRKSEIARKNREGRVSVHSVIAVEGRIEGGSVTARLIVNAVNSWRTAGEGEPLHEAITLNTTIGFTDKRRAAVKANKNDLAVTMRHEIELSSLPDSEQLTVQDEASIEATVLGGGLLAGTMSLSVTAGPQVLAEVDAQPPQTQEQGVTMSGVQSALSSAVRLMSAGFHRQQSGDAQYIEKITP